MYPFCPLHQASALLRNQGWGEHSWRRAGCWELNPPSPIFSLRVVYNALAADVAPLSTWALKLSFRSTNAPSHCTTADSLMTVPFERVTEYWGVCRRW